ncbi:MAG: type II toxin-antitoxin system VapC family toxin [Thermodesulfobacteriota bacterium]|nr:type II toxin-antitoxin system VapC family toxin [Thermodesulfobacteriota bacterium]
MNGNSALFDSNILIYLSKKELQLKIFDKFDKIFISVISYMEVFGFKFRSNKEENFVKELTDLFEVQFIDQNIVDKIIEIRKQNRIKLPDAIIAATAAVDNLCLVTRNIEDFKNIDITLLDPFDNQIA